jgi:hypothetical protein
MIGGARLLPFQWISVPENLISRNSTVEEWIEYNLTNTAIQLVFRRVCISQVSSSMHHFRKITKPGQLLPQGYDFSQSLEVLPRDLSPNLCGRLNIAKMIGLLLSNYM